MNVNGPKESILTDSTWKEMYPRGNYNKTDHGKSYVLHYLLALGQPEQPITSYIDKQTNGKIENLLKSDPRNHGLTPLMIATMLNRTAITRKLIELCRQECILPELLNAQDQHGWTASHHAVVSSVDEILPVLIEAGANQNIKTSQKGTVEDIKELTGKKIKHISSLNTTFQTLTEKKYTFSELPNEILREETNLKNYTDSPIYGADCLELLWKGCNDPEQSEHSDVGLNERSYDNFRQNPPKLIVKQSLELNNCDKRCYGLFADQFIPSGMIVGEYTGLAKNSRDTSDGFIARIQNQYESYLMPPYDAENIGNATRWANWGWPNTIIVPSLIEHGAERHLIVAAEPKGISSNEEIFYDYGIGSLPLAYGTQKIFNKDKIHAHFKPGLNVLQQQLKNKIRSSIGGIALIESLLLASKYVFPLGSPAVLIDLHYRGIVKAEDWIRMFLSNDPFVSTWIKKYPHMQWIHYCMFTQMIELDESMSKFPEIRDKFNSYMIEHIGSKSISYLLKVLSLVNTAINKETFTNKSWNDFINEQEESLVNYDWTKDPDHPLSIETRKKNKLYIFCIKYGGLNDEMLKTQIQDLRSIYLNALNVQTSYIKEELEITKFAIEGLIQSQKHRLPEELTTTLSEVNRATT